MENFITTERFIIVLYKPFNNCKIYYNKIILCKIEVSFILFLSELYNSFHMKYLKYYFLFQLYSRLEKPMKSKFSKAWTWNCVSSLYLAFNGITNGITSLVFILWIIIFLSNYFSAKGEVQGMCRNPRSMFKHRDKIPWMRKKGIDLNQDFYVVVDKQCHTENAYTGHQYNIFI